ncbi:ferredoxin [Mycobacterium haemophilum]
MRIVVSTSRCIGSGLCAMIAPSVFDQNPQDGTVQLLSAKQLSQKELERVREACNLCPSQAIKLTE